MAMSAQRIAIILFGIVFCQSCSSDIDQQYSAIDQELSNNIKRLRESPPTSETVWSELKTLGKIYDRKSDELQYVNFEFERCEQACLDILYSEGPAAALEYFLVNFAVLESLLENIDVKNELARFKRFPDNPATTDLYYGSTTLHLYWGDTHLHTNKSQDARRSPSYCLRFARDVSGLDFVALSDHDFQFKEPVEDWKDIRSFANRFNQEGHFVVLHGYEYGGRFGQGHQNVIFKDNNVPEIAPSWTEDASNTVWKLWNVLEGYQFLSIPHHSAYLSNAMGNNWMHHDPDVQPVVELLSIHGISERMNSERPLAKWGMEMDSSRTVQAALAKGLRFGFIGGSDSHNGKPGYYDPAFNENQRPGVTGVFAPALTRAEIFDSIRDRFCYATNGSRIFLFVSLNGSRMGSEITLAPETDKRIGVTVRGTDDIATIEIIENNRVVHIEKPNSISSEFQFTLKGVPIDPSNKVAAYSRVEKNVDWYYVRVKQHDGGMAWSSPIWVDYGYLP